MSRTTETSAETGVVKSAFGDSVYRDQADFRCALRTFLSYSERQARSAGITPQQHLLLLVTRGHRQYPNVSIGDIAEGLQIRHHSASLLVDRCVRRGLVDRNEDPSDRRRAIITLTSEGQRILDRVTRANRKQLNTLHGHLFRDTFLNALQIAVDDAAETSAG